MIKSTSEVVAYDELYDRHEEPVTVESHKDNPKMVGLIIGYHKVWVNAEDLQAAIRNATNTGSFL